MSDISQNASQTTNDGADAGADSLASLIADSFDELERGDAGDAEKTDDAGAADNGQATAADESGDEAAPDPETETGDAPAEVEAPGDFTAEEKALFAKLGGEAKALVASYAKRSQQSRTQVAHELDGLKRQVGPVGEALAPYRQHLQMLGAVPEQVVSGLMPYYIRLAGGDGETRRATIEHLARQFGVDLAARQSENEQEYVDPEVAKVRAELQSLKAAQVQQAQAAQFAHLRQAQAAVDAFRSAVDEKGAPRHPHFEKLEASMRAMIQGGLAKTLDDAYAKAAQLDPDIQAEKTRAAAEAQRRLAEKKAAEARKAAAANRKAPSAPARKNGALSARQSVEDAWDELYG